MRIGIIVAGLLAILLAAYNPGMDDFTAFVESETEVILQGRLGESPLGRALAGAGAGMIRVIVERVTERTNYFVFSTYTIDLAAMGGVPRVADDSNEEAWRFLGVAGRFVELHRPESLRR